MGKKGLPKTGGRKKGTPNKRTEELRETATRLGVSPFEVLLLFAKGDHQALGYRKGAIEPELRARCAEDACQYLEPKRKAIEHSAPGLEDAIKSLTDDQLDQRIEAELERLNGLKKSNP